MPMVTPGGSCLAGNWPSDQAVHVALPHDEATRRSPHIRLGVAAPTDGTDAQVDGDPEAALRARTLFEVFQPVADSSRRTTGDSA